MRNLEEVLSETEGLYGRIDSILKLSIYDEYDDLSGLEVDYQDGEQLFLLEELRTIMKSLDEVKDRLAYLACPVQEVSRLYRNGSGRYETAKGHYYTNGSLIEALVQDGYHEEPYWVRTSMEHDGRDYYLVGYQDVTLDGLTVRVRGKA